MAVDGDFNDARLMMLEYEHIKQEQRSRIGFRDNLLYATLASMAAVIATTAGADDRAFLLLLPPVSVILGWTYLVNDEKISAIGRYVRADLGPRLSALTGEGVPAFGWETAHRTDRRRVTRKYGQLVIDLLTFCLIPVSALCAFWFSAGDAPLLVLVSVAELAALLALGVQIFLYADLQR